MSRILTPFIHPEAASIIGNITDHDEAVKILAAYFRQKGKSVITTYGIYSSYTHDKTCYKTNGVDPVDLELHIDYNLRMRPGRMFIVDGIIVNRGYFSDSEATNLAKEFLADKTPQTQIHRPYY